MAGGFFSGGSSDAVNASVAEAEAAARAAEEARDEINDKFVEFIGQTDEGSYTVPNADDALTTKFLNQLGDWVIPAGNAGASTLDDLTDVTIANVATNQFLQYNGTQWVNVAVDPANPLTGGTGIDITNDVVSIEDGGVTTALIADNAVTSAKIPAGGVARTNIADNAIDDGKLNATNTGTANQILTAVGDGSFTWIDAAGETTYTASEGLTLVGDDFQIASDGVTTVKINDGAVTSAKILDNNVTADELNVTGDGTSGQVLSSDGDGSFTWVANGSGGDAYTADEDTLTLSAGNQFSVMAGGIDTAQIATDAVGIGQINSTNTPTANQLLQANLDNTVTWVDASGDTTYSAGTGLTLTGDEFSITAGGVTATEIADNTVGADELNVTGDGTSGQFLSSDGDGTFSWTTGSTTLRGLTDTSIPATITDRRLLEYEPSDGTWNATSISNILRISDMFDVHEDTPTDDQFLRYDASNADGPGWVNTTVSIPANLSFTAPLSRTNNTVSVAALGVTNALLADNSVDADKISVTGTSGQLLSTDSTGDLAWITPSAGTAYSAGTGLTLTGDEFSVTPDGITTALLANDAVTTLNIVDDAITSAKIVDGAVDTSEIAALAVTTAKIASNAITADQVAPNSLGATELASNAVSTFKLQSDSVTTVKVADDAITEPKLSITNAGTDGQVLSRAGSGFTWINNGSGGGVTYTAGTGLDLTGTEFSIADQGVDTTQIANDAITGTQLADGAVDTAELEDSAVETAKINDGAVTSGKLGTGAVTNAKIATGAVMSGSIGSDAVTTIKIIDAAVTSGKLATDIPISTFSDVNTTGVNNGQILSYNGTTWVPINNSGGGNTDNSRLAIALSPNSFNMGDAATSVTIELSIANAISGETISGQSVTITDPLGHTAAVSGSGNDWTFTPSTANAGNYVIRASATFTTGGTSTVHSASANLPIHAQNSNWYQTISATAPTTVEADMMTDNGVYSSPETAIFTSSSAATDARKAYLALPTRASGYSFRIGFLPASTLDVVGVISTNYTLYRVSDDDFDDRDSAATDIIITEA